MLGKIVNITSMNETLNSSYYSNITVTNWFTVFLCISNSVF